MNDNFEHRLKEYHFKKLRDDWAFQILIKLLDEVNKALNDGGVFQINVARLSATAYQLSDAMLEQRNMKNDEVINE